MVTAVTMTCTEMTCTKVMRCAVVPSDVESALIMCCAVLQNSTQAAGSAGMDGVLPNHRSSEPVVECAGAVQLYCMAEWASPWARGHGVVAHHGAWSLWQVLGPGVCYCSCSPPLVVNWLRSL
jgi:hypothetical protein